MFLVGSQAAKLAQPLGEAISSLLPQAFQKIGAGQAVANGLINTGVNLGWSSFANQSVFEDNNIYSYMASTFLGGMISTPFSRMKVSLKRNTGLFITGGAAVAGYEYASGNRGFKDLFVKGVVGGGAYTAAGNASYKFGEYSGIKSNTWKKWASSDLVSNVFPGAQVGAVTVAIDVLSEQKKKK